MDQATPIDHHESTSTPDQTGGDPPTPSWGRRFRFPLVVIALAILALAWLWLWPAPDREPALRVVGTEAVVLLGSAALMAWFTLLSPFRWLTRLRVAGAIVLLLVAAWTAIDKVEFTGDMVPVVYFRGTPTRDDILEQHRSVPKPQADTATAPPALSDLSGRLPSDYPEYRGRKRDGIVHGPALARDWKNSPPTLQWKQPCGGGYSAFAIAGNIAVTLEQRRDNEAIVCYDRNTGKERWIHEYLAHFSEAMGGDGPRATPTIADGIVYSLGASGMLVCLDADDGATRWSVDILKSNDIPNIIWGMSGSPLVYDNLVVVNAGGEKNNGVIAYDRETGKQVWSAGSSPAGYSSPMLAMLAGQRQIVLLDAKRVAGYTDDDGRELWSFPWKTNQGINVAQPLILEGDRVFISSGYAMGGAMLKIAQANDKWTATPVWQSRAMRCRFTNPVFYDGFIYGLDEGILVCLDAETGKRQWKEGRFGHGQILLTGDLILVLSETGDLVLVEANPKSFRELGRVPVLEGKTWNCPALSGPDLFVRNHLEMACYRLPLVSP